ncbi:alanine--tRNA ligase [Peptostreptococcus sp. D1]|uniref:alanine--tRNA ligase n=1 Tax=Peptostreptococcus sp. D1 TaxID=72304 RepID=UPI0008E11CF3|nr:alanine--tRNA ligase [Peptostreptococcus sp. D1]SFE64357.1 alanyl-tRNA synthetase [Peptostreptococcus sp. D1]
MKKLGLNELRKMYKDFFEAKGHYIAKSHSLVPSNDKSLLLINSGMAPLKNYFSGVEKPPKNRMCTVQKCIRTGDIENVGVTARHATFFEMMGNFSFGDYFKHDAIHWSWEFITEWLQIPEERLWVTVYESDDEAFELWEKEIGFPKEKIVRLGKDDNFWEIGLGPCGPCSEIYFDKGEKYGCGCEDCKPGCDCDRYLEFWNLVFTQFDRQEDGTYQDLEHKNIDTGMGLERIGCVMQDVDTIFEVDTIQQILNKVTEIAGKKYGENPANDKSIRIITDHIRSVSFMVGDGILPSNEGRGYVLRRLLRRAARHGKLLGIDRPFLQELMEEVAKTSGEAYPELVEKKSYIKKVIGIEEEKFAETLGQGLEILKGYTEEVIKSNGNEITGEMAFKLYDTYGFPIDLTLEILEDEGLTLDQEGFEKEMQAQKDRARAARGNREGDAWKEDPLASLEEASSQFKGYFELSREAKIKAIVFENQLVDNIEEGSEAEIVLDETTFYANGGGQVGDKGIIDSDQGIFKVIDTIKGANGSIKHIGYVESGHFGLGDKVYTHVNKSLRMDAARNHSATHLLHKALKMVLGEHVNQAGSLVEPDRLRFDITHFEPISKEELSEIEKIVNSFVLDSIEITDYQMNIEEAKEMGATALFGEKYGDVVRVVKMGEASIELCGGTHLKNTSEVGLFKILSEGGVAAGVRRIEAITGRAVYNYILEKDSLLENVAEVLKTREDNLYKKAASLTDENKELERELHSLKTKLSMESAAEALKNKIEINGVALITNKYEAIDNDTLREAADNLRDRVENGVAVVSSVNEGKLSFVATASKGAIDKGVHAGNLVREVAKVTGGKGGGRPNMAQAGGVDISKIDEAFEAAKAVVESQIG